MNAINKKIAFIGAGNMAEALIAGLVACGSVAPKNIAAADIRPERLAYLKKKYRIATMSDAKAAAGGSDVVFLSVKPQHMEALLSGMGKEIRRGQLVISIAAGITTKFIERFLDAGVAVIRAMPNTPALVGSGAIAVAKGRKAGPKDAALAASLFSSSGLVVELPESKIDAVTALSGSGPAYVFYLTEALERAGTMAGLPKKTASLLARQTVFGAGKMLGELPVEPAELRRRVTSPGGTTAAAIEYMDSNDFSEIVAQAVERARRRARELAR